MKNDLLNGKPVRSILSFALPIMASSMLQYNYNLVDNIIVGRFVFIIFAARKIFVL